MKKIILYAILPIALASTSCSSNYLDLEPQNSYTANALFASPDEAQYIINGIGRLQQSQFSYAGQGFNGEGTIMFYFSDRMGPDMQQSNYTSWAVAINNTYYSRETVSYNNFSWYYHYKIIGNANLILENIPEDGGALQNEWNYLKAQALTYRAYCYMRLTQTYCRRWSDRQGASRGVPLRLDSSTDPLACSSLAEVYQRIYADLDEAIKLFNSCGVTRGTGSKDYWLTSAEVAHAIYSRAALWREDYNTCITHSQAARANCSIMGTDNYYGGFNEPNSEWIWAAYCDETQTIYYYPLFAYIATNANSTRCRTNPPAMSRELVEQIPAVDTRLWLTMIPTEEELPDMNNNANAKAVSKGDFYTRVKTEYSDRILSNTAIYYFECTKFQCAAQYGIGQIPLFRAAEMYYNEAESQLALGQEASVRQILEEVTQPYNPDYTCTATGQALKDELRIYRRFDLWGEGHSWFDLKRWGESLVRHTWEEGGSWNASFCGDGTGGGTGANCGPTDKNNWTFYIPQIETNYNDLVTGLEPDNWSPSNQ